MVRVMVTACLAERVADGWGDQTVHDIREFFDSLGPVSDPAHLVESLNRRG